MTIRGENGTGDAVRITDHEQLAAMSGFLQLRGVVGDGVMPGGLYPGGPTVLVNRRIRMAESAG